MKLIIITAKEISTSVRAHDTRLSRSITQICNVSNALGIVPMTTATGTDIIATTPTVNTSNITTGIIGNTKTFATGAITETPPKRYRTYGAVAICAQSVSISVCFTTPGGL